MLKNTNVKSLDHFQREASQIYQSGEIGTKRNNKLISSIKTNFKTIFSGDSHTV